MKLSIGLSAALVSFAAAAQQAAEVFILPLTESTRSTTSISPSEARMLLLQRIAPSGKGPSSHDIPESVSPEDAVSLMNKYGKASVSMFGDGGDRDEASQLVVMLEDMTAAEIKELSRALGRPASLTIANPPSSRAHDKLVKNDFYNAGITNEHSCGLDQVMNPFEKDCWSGKATVAKYSVAKDSSLVKKFIGKLPKLQALAASGEMETTVILLPTTPETSATKQWSDKPQELRRRQAESVISAADDVESANPTSAAEAPVFLTSMQKIPSCFKSEDSCNQGTRNCSGHGSCVNKNGKRDDSEDKNACFTCQCKKSTTKAGSVMDWVGPACSKQDISVQFWLFAGFTIFLVGILAGSIGLLFSVGEEKLPGVIGAGVSKSK